MKTSKVLKKALDILSTLLIVAVAASILVTYVIKVSSGSKTAQTTVFGYVPTVVPTGSMLPTIQINALSIVHCCDISKVQEGDIIVYYSERRQMNIIHRAISVTGEGSDKVIITKGDNNLSADPDPITKDNFIGISVANLNGAAPVVGKLLKSDGSGFDPVKLLIAALSLFLVLWGLLELISRLLKPLRKSPPPIPGDEKDEKNEK